MAEEFAVPDGMCMWVVDAAYFADKPTDVVKEVDGHDDRVYLVMDLVDIPARNGDRPRAILMSAGAYERITKRRNG